MHIFSSEKLFLTFEIALSCILVKSFLSIIIDCLIAIDKACGSLGLTLKPVKLLPFLIVSLTAPWSEAIIVFPAAWASIGILPKGSGSIDGDN